MKLFLALLAVLICLVSPALTDTVQTKSGETFKGRVIEDTKEQLRLKTAFGVLTIPRAEVQKHDRTTYIVELNDGTKLTGQISGETEKELTLLVDGKTQAVPLADVKGVSEKKPEPPPQKPPEPKKPSPQEIMAAHQRAMEFFGKKEYQKSIAEYERVLKTDPEDIIALYNTACAYSLLKDKPKALDFLKKSVEAGYVNFAHMEQDTDLDGLREEEVYKAIFAAKDEYIRKSTEKVVSRLHTTLAQRGVDAKKYRHVLDEERNFVYLHTKTDDELAVIRKSVEEYAEYQWKHLFQNKPQQPLYIVLLTAPDSQKVFRGGAGGVFNAASNTLLCGDIPAMTMMKTSVVIHEFTHALHFADMQARRQQHPIWLVEGLATLFESSDRNGDVVPHHSYRLNVIQGAINMRQDIPWTSIMTMNHPQFMSRAHIAYAQARYMLFYMHENGVLKKFYDEYTDKAHYESDKSARESVEVVFGKPIESVERDWRAWVLKQTVPPLPFLGVQTADRDGRAAVTQVVGGSPADKAGIKVGDLITALAGQPIRNGADVMEAVASKKPDDEVEVTWLRDGKESKAMVKLGKRQGMATPPPPKSAPYIGITVEQKDAGVCVKDIDKDSPADKAGIKVGMALVEFNGTKVASVREFLAAFRKTAPGQKVKVKVKEGEVESELAVQVAKQPEKGR